MTGLRLATATRLRRHYNLGRGHRTKRVMTYFDSQHFCGQVDHHARRNNNLHAKRQHCQCYGNTSTPQDQGSQRPHSGAGNGTIPICHDNIAKALANIPAICTPACLPLSISAFFNHSCNASGSKPPLSSTNGNPARDPTSCGLPAHAPLVKTCSSSRSGWLPPLKSWSLRQSRGRFKPRKAMSLICYEMLAERQGFEPWIPSRV